MGTPAPKPRYPDIKEARGVIEHVRAFNISNTTKYDKESVTITEQYSNCTLFSAVHLVTQMLEWNRTPQPNSTLSAADPDCVGMIEAYIEHHSGPQLRQFWQDMDDAVAEGEAVDIDYRIAKMVLREAEARGVEGRRLECFVQAVSNVFLRREEGEPRVYGDISMRYICISMHSTLNPLLSPVLLASLKHTLPANGFIIRSSTPPPQLLALAAEVGTHMRVQIYRYIVLLEAAGDETAHGKGTAVARALWDVLENGGRVERGSTLHRTVWNAGWELELVGRFWNGVKEGFLVRREECGGEGKGLGEVERAKWFEVLISGVRGHSDGDGGEIEKIGTSIVPVKIREVKSEVMLVEKGRRSSLAVVIEVGGEGGRGGVDEMKGVALSDSYADEA